MCVSASVVIALTRAIANMHCYRLNAYLTVTRPEFFINCCMLAPTI